jgi:hypothetical protein
MQQNIGWIERDSKVVAKDKRLPRDSSMKQRLVDSSDVPGQPQPALEVSNGEDKHTATAGGIKLDSKRTFSLVCLTALGSILVCAFLRAWVCFAVVLQGAITLGIRE